MAIDAELYHENREGIQGVGPFDPDLACRSVQEAEASLMNLTRVRHVEYIALAQRLTTVLAKWRQTRAEDEHEWFKEHQEADYHAVPVRFYGSDVKIIPIDTAVRIGERRVNNQPEADLYAS